MGNLDGAFYFDRVRDRLRWRCWRTGKGLESLDSAFAFLHVAFRVHRWHSDRTLLTNREEMLEQLRHFEQWQETLEAHMLKVPFAFYGPGFMYPGDLHPLGLYVISSQFAWHQFRLPEARRHLLHSLHLARQFVPRSPLEEGESSVHESRLKDPRFYGVNHFYLGELEEESGAETEALRHYLEFIEWEPAFSPRNAKRLDGDFFDLSFFYPSTVEALKRVGVMSLRSKDTQGRERARSCFEKALALPASHHSPFREYAALLREDGDETRALHLEEEWRRTLASYPEEMSGTLAWAYKLCRE
ncbi:hypothetical protein [Myxococcus stipitatus]|uniref:hypothetical protein n=1 Tax=Myxococcus stipitatus TaxID=83455 RepID=UPI0030D0253E